MKSHA